MSDWAINLLVVLLTISGSCAVWWLNNPAPLVTLNDLFVWADRLDSSADQLQKTYDWRISQWSAFGNAILTATLGFVSASVVELVKAPLEGIYSVPVMVIGILASLALYAISQWRIVQLRNEFLVLYTLVAHLH